MNTDTLDVKDPFSSWPLRIISAYNYAYLDLATAVIIFLALLFPQYILALIDMQNMAFLGALFVLLFAGRGFLAIVAMLFFRVIEWIVRWLKVEVLSAILNYVKKMFLISIMGYLDGLGLLMVFVILTMPLTLPFFSYMEQSHFQELSFIFSPLKEPYLANKGILMKLGEATFGWIHDDSEKKYGIFVICVVLTAFSYLALFSIKRFNFSISSYFVNSPQAKQGHELLMKVVRNELQEIPPF